MSQLPKGTLATRAFLESLILKGAMAQAFVWAPWLDFPVLRNFVEALITNILIKPTGDEIAAIAIASTYIIDRAQFDKAFIALKMLEKQGATNETLETALQNAERAMERFIKRGPIT